MKNILVMGCSHASWVVNSLRKEDKINKYFYVDIHEIYKKKNVFTIFKAIFNLIRTDTFFLVFAPVRKIEASLLRLTLLLTNKKIVIDWVGSDVLTLLQNKGKDVNFYNKCINLCEVDWIRDELQTLGINAKVGPCITQLSDDLEKSRQLEINKNKFIAMSYSIEGKETFYGIDKIINIAEKFPNILFKIVGSQGKKYNYIPKNVIFLGWIESTKEIMEESSVFIRIPEHDGLSLSVLEALYYGKQVAFSFPLPHTSRVYSQEDLEKYISKQYIKWQNNENILNKEGSKYVYEEYFKHKKTFLNNIIKEF